VMVETRIIDGWANIFLMVGKMPTPVNELTDLGKELLEIMYCTVSIYQRYF